MIFSHSAFNDSLTNALYCTILSLTKECIMRIAKIGVIALFLFMALGGIGGVMLAGYTFILRAG
ncbi:hypothetical protein ECZU01_15140 [Escherichia coli]|nr:hypothetical protein ECZU01_15140 [Escherichia coli]